MGCSTHLGGGVRGVQWQEGRRLKSPKGEGANKGPFRRKQREVDVGAAVPPLSRHCV